MHPRPQGNGSGKFNIHQSDMGGWVRVFTDKVVPVPEDLPFYLSHALTEWFRQRPQLRMRSVLGVVKEDSTVELHAWYDLHAFPDLAQAEARAAVTGGLGSGFLRAERLSFVWEPAATPQRRTD